MKQQKFEKNWLLQNSSDSNSRGLISESMEPTRSLDSAYKSWKFDSLHFEHTLEIPVAPQLGRGQQHKITTPDPLIRTMYSFSPYLRNKENEGSCLKEPQKSLPPYKLSSVADVEVSKENKQQNPEHNENMPTLVRPNDYVEISALSPIVERQQILNEEKDLHLPLFFDLEYLGFKNIHLKNWRAPKYEPDFCEDHVRALRFLSSKGMTCEQAINEINELNACQANILITLYSRGFSGENLRSWQSPKFGSFFTEHAAALKFLAKRGIIATQAINEINGLNDRQARALIVLYDTGIRGEHLRSWKSPIQGCFSQSHIDALKFFSQNKVIGQQAIEKINQLDCLEVEQLIENRSINHNSYFGGMEMSNKPNIEIKEYKKEEKDLNTKLNEAR